MRWPLTFYVDQLDNDAAGQANGPVIRILKSHKDDEGVYQHELEHVIQWFVTLGIHSLLYWLFESYRLWAEVSAYRIQLAHNPPDWPDYAELYAGFIAEPKYYGLHVSQAEVVEMLKSKG